MLTPEETKLDEIAFKLSIQSLLPLRIEREDANFLFEQARQAITLQKKRDAWKRLARAHEALNLNWSTDGLASRLEVQRMRAEQHAAEDALRALGQEV